MDVREMGLEDADWIHLAKNRELCRASVITVMNLRDLLHMGSFLTW